MDHGKPGARTKLEIERLFVSLFRHMAEGVALHEVVLDASEKAVDYRILDVNPQYERYTGLPPRAVIGKLASEAYGTPTAPYLEEFTSVALGAPPARLDTYFRPLDRHYEISVAPLAHGFFATIFLDVTERKRQESALREQQWFLQASQRVGHLGSYRFNVATGFWINSAAMDEVLGIDASFPRTSESWLSLVHPDDREVMAKYLLEHVIRDGNTFDRRYRIHRHSDGGLRWVHGYGELERGPDGKPTFMIGTIQDITDLVANEQALQTKTEELDRFFSLTIDLLCIANLEGRFIRMNEAWTTSLGWAVSELEGSSFMDLIHPDDRSATLAAVQILSSGRNVIDFTNRYRTKDGRYRVIEWRSSPGPDGLIYAAARDVTERLESERALRASEERFRRIFDLVPSPLALTDMGGTVLDCNQAFSTVSGRARNEVLGHTTLDLGLWPDAAKQKRLEEMLASEGEVRNVELELRQKDGKRLTVLCSGRVEDVGGQKAMLLTTQDITEQRNLERQMLHSQKLESLGVLAGGIAHDFNNLLAGVLGNADLALMDVAPSSPARESLTGISQAARRASELCRQLLAYSGKGRYQVQPVNLAELVHEMGPLLAISISKKAVLKYQFAPDLPAIEADATQLRQVIMNLILNASEAIGERNGVISLTTGLVHCDAEYLGGAYCAEGIVPGDFVYLEIADTGQGMDRAIRDRIFDPFFTTKFMGRGLGLAAVLGIVRGHRGAIRVYSEPERGTTFKLLFPASPDLTPRPLDKARASAPWQGKGLILVVDDEEAIRSLSRRMLERSGFAVVTASDGREAIEKFRIDQDTIVLVVLDLTMPHLDGEACFRMLREIKPDVKVLLSSGYNEQDVVSLFAGKCPAAFIQKPYATRDLITKVREVLGE
jgi:two-component system, cell cycle sensor histidine kinase and response regulator CckA